jgi:hypothetical protein
LVATLRTTSFELVVDLLGVAQLGAGHGGLGEGGLEGEHAGGDGIVRRSAKHDIKRACRHVRPKKTREIRDGCVASLAWSILPAAEPAWHFIGSESD